MSEFIQQALLPYNLPLTILMGAVTVFWILSLLGTIDLDGLDFDFDTDTDVDLDTEVSAGHNYLGTALKFVNAQDVPIMMVLSLLTLFMWVFSILMNSVFNPEHSGLLALGLLLANFIGSTLCVKAITHPVRPFFRAIKKDEEVVPLVGSVGTVKSRTIDTNFGQVSVTRENGAPALLNARLEDGELARGETVVIVSYDEDKKRYLAKSAPELTTNLKNN